MEKRILSLVVLVGCGLLVLSGVSTFDLAQSKTPKPPHVAMADP